MASCGESLTVRKLSLGRSPGVLLAREESGYQGRCLAASKGSNEGTETLPHCLTIETNTTRE